MKENKIEKTEIEFIRFSASDVITTSSMSGNGQNSPSGYGGVTDFGGGGIGQPLQ